MHEKEISIVYRDGIQVQQQMGEVAGVGTHYLLEVDTSGSKKAKTSIIQAFLEEIRLYYGGLDTWHTERLTEMRIGERKKGKNGFDGSTDFRYDVVVRDIALGSVGEYVYLTRKTRAKKGPEVHFVGTKGEKFQEINAGVLERQGVESSTIVLFAAILLRCTDYQVKWQEEKKELQLIKEGKVIQVEDIKDKEVYTLVKLYTHIMCKSEKKSIFFINGSGMCSQIVQGMIDLIRGTATTSEVYLYNIPTKLKQLIRCNRLELQREERKGVKK